MQLQSASNPSITAEPNPYSLLPTPYCPVSVLDAHDDRRAGDDRVAEWHAQPALDRLHAHLTVRQLGLHGLGIHARRVRNADRYVDQHPPAALAHLAQEGEARMPDRVGDGP